MRLDRQGFTMMELIFVIVIIGILAGIAIPKMNTSHDSAVATKDLTLMRQYQQDARAYLAMHGANAKDQSDFGTYSNLNGDCFRVGLRHATNSYYIYTRLEIHAGCSEPQRQELYREAIKANLFPQQSIDTSYIQSNLLKRRMSF